MSSDCSRNRRPWPGGAQAGAAGNRDERARAGIALGSNLGDRLHFLKEARDQICAHAEFAPPLLQSSIYETAPVGCEPGADNFYNAVIELGCESLPEDLLTILREIENTLGRPWGHPRNVARTIDLDLLYVGKIEMKTAELQLPHPRMAEREFVLRPLAEIAPELRLPGQTATVSELLARGRGSEKMKLVLEQW